VLSRRGLALLRKILSGEISKGAKGKMCKRLLLPPPGKNYQEKSQRRSKVKM